jgi:hypothetical protein
MRIEFCGAAKRSPPYTILTPPALVLLAGAGLGVAAVAAPALGAAVRFLAMAEAQDMVIVGSIMMIMMIANR